MNLDWSVSETSVIENQVFNITIHEMYAVNVPFELSANWRRPSIAGGDLESYRINSTRESGEVCLLCHVGFYSHSALYTQVTLGYFQLADELFHNVSSYSFPIVTYNDFVGQPTQVFAAPIEIYFGAYFSHVSFK
jgi:hypothetical protein